MPGLTIGSIIVPSRCMLAPLAGISDLSFRRLNRCFGCELACVEMLSAKSLAVHSRTAAKMLRTNAQDRPLGLQLVGSDPKDLRAALDVISGMGVCLIDFNAACPVRKVVRRGEGAALLLQPEKLQDLLAGLVAAAPVPVTLKIRSGWDASNINAVEIARRAEDAGVQAITIHGRTRAQQYRDRVSRDVIRQVKEAVGIPVLGSGDVFSGALAAAMLQETGCDGVAVARGALGNPWIFREIACALAGLPPPVPPQPRDVAVAMHKHLDLVMQLHDERTGVMLFRKFFAWYTHGFARIKPLRVAAFATGTWAAMDELIDNVGELTLAAPRHPAGAAE